MKHTLRWSLPPLLLAASLGACAPLVQGPKDKITGIPDWVRRHDDEDGPSVRRGSPPPRPAPASVQPAVPNPYLSPIPPPPAPMTPPPPAPMTPAPAIPTPVVDEAAPTPVPAPEAPPVPVEAPAVPAAPEVAPASEGSGIQESPAPAEVPAVPAAPEVAPAPVEVPAVPAAPEVAPAPVEVPAVPAAPEVAPASEGSGIQESPAPAEVPAVPAVPAAPEVAPASEGSGTAEPPASEGSGTAATPASEGSGTAATPADVWSVRFEGRSGRVGIETAPGRDGSFFVPDVPAGQPVPVVVLIHGPGGSGAEIARRFEPLARHFGFAIVAPDASSQLDGLWAWMRSRRIADRTPDAEHVMRSIEWVESTTGVRFDRRRVLVAGYSQGSKAAAWLGSNEELFTHVAVLHGGVSVDAMGWHDAAYWLSTTRGDSFRNPVRLNRTADSVATAGFGRLTVRIFDGGDALTRIEIEGLIRWFLGA